MVVLVTGDRWWWDYDLMLRVIAEWHDRVWIDLVVHGACRGADNIAGWAADCIGVPEDRMPADWDKDGHSAGPIRNRRMLYKHPDVALVLAFHDHIHSSKGTRDMVMVALRREIPVCLVSHEGEMFPLPMDFFESIHNSLDKPLSRA